MKEIENKFKEWLKDKSYLEFWKIEKLEKEGYYKAYAYNNTIKTSGYTYYNEWLIKQDSYDGRIYIQIWEEIK